MFCVGTIISVIFECKARGITQSAIVTTILRSLDEQCHELSNDAASCIARGVKNPSVYVMDAVSKLSPESYATIADYFRSHVIEMIKENDRKLVMTTLLLMIQEEQVIADDTVVEIVSRIKKSELAEKSEDLATFLAGIFLYALKNTENNVGGKVKDGVKDYIDRARAGAIPEIKSLQSIPENTTPKEDVNRRERSSREVELMEERIMQEATTFCVKHDQERDYIPLCQIACITNPLRHHAREMYNEFNTSTASTRNKILEMNEIEKVNVSGEYWWTKYLDMFERDYKKYELGDVRYLYSFGQYFYRLLEYKEEPIGECRGRFFPAKVITPIMKTFRNTDLDVFGLIDEYMYYGKMEEYKDILVPPMDCMWEELDFGGCEESKLVIYLALFIIGACRCFPLKNQEENQLFAYSGPSVHDIETAEDLFYETLLVLYETYS